MTFQILTLGCKVNTYESEVMKEKLLSAGYKETEDIADIYIINTCTVTDTSSHKSLKTIRQCLRKNPHAVIVACGCMVQADPTLDTLKDVSILLGNQDKSKIVDLLTEYQKNKKQN